MLCMTLSQLSQWYVHFTTVSSIPLHYLWSLLALDEESNTYIQ
ncbi:unnamed protein product [Brassica rapa subsp. trilocularis]|uniref:Uncharacterized protein n=1 Tax=Brassica campestris TaxID=3711 RepID=A0A3P6AHN8_BRACM|nr:unnamed protein product [Brassica rapa]